VTATDKAVAKGEAAAKALADPATIPWGSPVELFTLGPKLSVRREDMTLRDAVRRFMVLPRDAQCAVGIGMHEPYLATLNDRPVAMGFLNADVIRQLSRVLEPGV
jgi:hypothetical protein